MSAKREARRQRVANWWRKEAARQAAYGRVTGSGYAWALAAQALLHWLLS